MNENEHEHGHGGAPYRSSGGDLVAEGGEARTRQAIIHDLGYRRYHGPRRPQSSRWRVIVRNLLGMSWRGWWRYKVPLMGCVITAVVVGVIMFLGRNEIFEAADASSEFKSIADSFVVRSFYWFGNSAFIVSLTVLANNISKDLSAGAFEFYFSRPVRTIDYVAGKIAGAFLLMVPVMVIGPLVLTLFRLGLSEDLDEAVGALPWVGKSIIVGVVACLAYGVVPLAFGALSRKPRNAIAVYAAFTIVFGSIVKGVAMATHSPDLAALHLGSAVDGFATRLFDAPFTGDGPMPSLLFATLGVLGYVAVAAGFIYIQVRAAERAGLGGG